MKQRRFFASGFNVRITLRIVFISIVLAPHLVFCQPAGSQLRQEDGDRETITAEDEKRFADMRIQARFVCLTIPQQRPTVLELIFGPAFYNLELSDSQISQISEVGLELREGIEEFLEVPSIERKGLSQIRSMIERFSDDDSNSISDVRKDLEEARDEVRSKLLPHQMDELLGAAMKAYGYRAIEYQEIAELLNITEAQRSDLSRGIEQANREFFKEAIPPLPPSEIREALRAIGAQSAKEGMRRTEEQLAIARINRDVKLLHLLEDVLRPEQLEEINRLIELGNHEE